MAPKSREVGIRLSVKDKEIAERALKQFGKEGQAALRSIEKAGKPASGSLLAVNTAVHAGRTAVGSFMAGAIAAIAPVVSLGAAIHGARSALMEFDKIAKQAKASGLDEEFFQELGYAAELGGVSLDELAVATATFAKNAGLAAQGKGRMVTQLKALNPELLRNIQLARSQEERIKLVAEAIDQEADASKRAAVASALFGDVGARMVEVFKGGEEQLAATAAQARQLGIVVDRDLLSKAEEMSDAFETANKVMDMQFKQTLISLAPLLVSIAQLAGDVARAIRSVVEAGWDVGDRSSDMLEQQLASLQAIKDKAEDGLVVSRMQWESGGEGRYNEILAELRKRAMYRLTTQLTQQDTGGDRGSLPPSDEAKAAIKEAEALTKRLRDASEVYADTLGDLTTKLDAGLIGQETFNRGVVEAVMAFADAADGTADYAEALAALNAAREAGILSEKKYTAAVEDLTRKRLVAQNDWLAGLQMGLMDIVGETDQVTTEVGGAVRSWANSLGDAIGQVFRTGKFEWRDLVQTMLADIAKMVTQQTITRPLAGLLGSLFGSALGGTGGGNGFIPGITGPSLIGNNANGTDYWRGGLTWVGEQGKELVNLPRGAQVIPNHRLGAVGTSVTLAPSYYVNGSGLSEAQLGRVLEANNEQLLRLVPGVVKKAIGNGVFG